MNFFESEEESINEIRWLTFRGPNFCCRPPKNTQTMGGAILSMLTKQKKLKQWRAHSFSSLFISGVNITNVLWFFFHESTLIFIYLSMILRHLWLEYQSNLHSVEAWESLESPCSFRTWIVIDKLARAQKSVGKNHNWILNFWNLMS